MPDLNTLPVQPGARSPRGAVKLGTTDASGNTTFEVVPGWLSWEVDNNAFRSADTFRVVFIVTDLPPDRDANWFSTQKNLPVEILGGFPSNPDRPSLAELDSQIYGETDHIALDIVAGTIELTGRDLTARLIDTKTSENFANQTSSQIAIVLAQRHGLTPVVTATTTKVGDYYQDDHNSTTQQRSEWELLTYLANVEDFVLYVRGRELHFEPRPAPQADRYVIQWDPKNADRAYPVSNMVNLQFTRDLTIAKGVSVEVHSWNAKQKKGFIAYWPIAAKPTKPGQSGARTQVYKYTIAGLTQEAAQQRAQSIYKQIVAHEVRLSGYLPADAILYCTKTIEVRGTRTAFDQVYFPESVMRSMSITEGYRMNIRAKNTGPELEEAQS